MIPRCWIALATHLTCGLPYKRTGERKKSKDTSPGPDNELSGLHHFCMPKASP